MTGIASTVAGEDSGITLAELAKGRVRSWSFDASPFWWRDAPLANGQQASPRATADVVVVGAGYTGLTAALTLARAGRDVIVVDAGVPGFGASTRNGGQVGSGNQKFRVKTLIEMKGERLAVDLLREGIEMLDGIERLIHQEKIDCAFTRCGRFRGAMHPTHYEAMARDMEDLGRYAGVRSLMMSRHEQHREVGTDLFLWFVASDGCQSSSGQISHGLAGTSHGSRLRHTSATRLYAASSPSGRAMSYVSGISKFGLVTSW